MAPLSLSAVVAGGGCVTDNAPPAEICARIEGLVEVFLQSLMSESPIISSLPLVRRNKNTRVLHDRRNSSLFLKQITFSRHFTTKRGMKGFVRVWKVLNICYQLLQSGKRSTQREIYYRLLSDPSSGIQSPQQVNDAIQDVVALLKCSRHSLGIFASGKGLLVGRVFIQDLHGTVIDCNMLGSNYYSVSGDISYLEQLTFHSDARYILLVEKETVFQQLASDRLYQFLPSIIITGKGYPDLATRVLLARLHHSFPSFPIFALVDWNPDGVAILCTYKLGSLRMGLESPHYVCDVKWLGMRHDDVKYTPCKSHLDLKDRDLVLARNLLESEMLKNHENYRTELSLMLQRGKRVELEALHENGVEFLRNFIAQKIVRQDYI